MVGKKVTIGMPVYNGERFLREAISCLLEQDHQEFELIISDNCSTDATESICKGFAQQDSRIIYHKNKVNLGALNNFNNLISMAQGDYFMWAASDDKHHPSFLSTMINYLENPGISLAFCIPNAIDESGNVFSGAPRFMELSGSNPFDCMERFILQDEIWGKANLVYGLMKMKDLRTTDGFRVWSWNDWGIDHLFVFNMLRFGRFAIHPDALFFKRLILVPFHESVVLYPKKRPNLRGKLTKLNINFLEYKMFCGYLYGYWRIINSFDNLLEKEKRSLAKLCLLRARQKLTVFKNGVQ
jgi:glycosyltransferase involved in cell wall biosynthesis